MEINVESITKMKWNGILKLVFTLNEMYTHSVCVGTASGFGFPSSAVWFDDRQFGLSVLLSVVCVFSNLLGR